MTEQKESFKNFVEDVARIWLEYLVVHSGDGITLEEETTDENGLESVVLVKVPQAALEQLQATVKIDVTPKGVYDKFAQEQSLENLLKEGFFGQRISELKRYLKALPDDSVMPKTALEKIVEDYEEEQRKIAMIQAEAQMMQQRAQQFLMGDPDEQASQMADAQAQMMAQQAQQQIPGEAEVEAKEEKLPEPKE
jgi:hypothetical protein